MPRRPLCLIGSLKNRLRVVSVSRPTEPFPGLALTRSQTRQDFGPIPDVQVNSSSLSEHSQVLREEFEGANLVMQSDRNPVLPARDAVNCDQFGLVYLLTGKKIDLAVSPTHVVGDGKSENGFTQMGMDRSQGSIQKGRKSENGFTQMRMDRSRGLRRMREG